MRGWIDDAKADSNDIGDLAESLGLERKRKSVECPRCGDRHSDGKLTGYVGRNNLIHCRRDCKAVDVVGLVALRSGLNPSTPEEWRQLQAECAALGLCEPPRDLADDAIREMRRRRHAAKWQMQTRRLQREAEEKAARAAQLPDVAGQLERARAQTLPAVVEAFARDTRRMPAPVAQAIAASAMIEGIVDATDLRQKWARRWRRKVRPARVLAFPVYGADGIARSAALRRSDGLAFELKSRQAKSLNLRNSDTGGGMDRWPGVEQVEGDPLRCRSFGSVPAGVDKAIAEGCALWLAEGEIDAMALRGFLAAQGLPGVVIGADGVGQLANIARVAEHYAAGRALQVVMVSDRDSDPMTRAPAAQALTAVRGIFPSTRHLDITDLAGDLADVLDVEGPLAAEGVDGLAELAKRVERLQRFPDARGWTIPHTADATAQRLPDLDLAEMRGRVTAIRASMGTGKTYQAGRLTAQVKALGGVIVSAAPSQALALGMAQRLGLQLYSDTKGAITDSAVFCINSLGRFRRDAPPRLLIIDEFEQVTAAITQGTVPHFVPHGQGIDSSIDVHQILYTMIRRTIAAGGAVMVCDANLSDISLDLLRRWTPGRVEVVEHRVEAVGRVVMVPTPDDALAVATQAAADGQRIGYMTDYAGNVAGIAQVLDAAYPSGHSVKTYTGGSLEGRKADLRDPRTAWGKGRPGAPSAVVCSPVVGSGVDAEAVDLVVCEFHGVIDAAACMQMMGRFRGSTRFVIYAAEGAPRGSLPTDYAAIRAEFEGKAQASEEAPARFLEGRHKRGAQSLSPYCQNESDALHMETCIQVERLQRLRRQDYRAQIAACLTSAGYTVEHDVDRPSPALLQAAQQGRSQASDALERAERASIASATPCSALDLQRFEREGYKTDDDRHSAEAARLMRDHGEVSAELVEADAGRRRMSKAGREVAGAALAIEGQHDHNARIDARNLEGGGRGSQRGVTRRRFALACLVEAVFGERGARVLLGPVDPAATLPAWSKATITPEACAELYERLTDSGPGLSFKPNEPTGHGFRPRQVKTPAGVMKAIGQLLKAWGLSWTTRRPRANGHARVRSIDDAQLRRWLEWMAPFHARARGVRCNGLDPSAPAPSCAHTVGDWHIAPNSYVHKPIRRSFPVLNARGQVVQTSDIYISTPVRPAAGGAA